MEIYFNPYPGAAQEEKEGIQYAVKAAEALFRLKKAMQKNFLLTGKSPGEDVDVSLSKFVLVKGAGTPLGIGDIIRNAPPLERTKLQLLLHTFSQGKIIEAIDIADYDDWIIDNIGASAPILGLAAKSKAIALTIPSEEVWRRDLLPFKNHTETLHNLWGQKDISQIVTFCIESIKNIPERFSAKFKAKFCDGALNTAPNTANWEHWGFFRNMERAQKREYAVDNDLVKTERLPKTKNYGRLLELRIKDSGHRILFAHRKESSPEILIGGFYQKNEAMSQSEAIQDAKKRIDNYKD
jgi:hypothetical protein